MNLCACGCGALVRQKWHIGHNRRGVPPTNKIGGTVENGYRFIYQPSHPAADAQGYVAEHRLVVERALGRYLHGNEVVHHLNGNRLDNRLANLAVLTKAEHDRITVMVSERCKVCGAPHRARGLCSSCYGKFYRSGRAMPFRPSRRNRWTRRLA